VLFDFFGSAYLIPIVGPHHGANVVTSRIDRKVFLLASAGSWYVTNVGREAEVLVML